MTAEEHWIVHLLLTKIYPNNTKLVFACQAMSMVSRNNKRTTNKLFGWVRRKYSEAISKTRAGRKLSDDHKLRISKTLKGRPLLHQQGENNVSKRPEVAKKISEANKGRVLGPRSDETKSRISAATKGRKGLTGDANPSSWRVSCIKCKKETSIPILGKHHKKCV